MNETNKKYNYTQGEKIYFNMGPGLPSGWGKVCGCQGPIVIIELDQPIKNYPFTCLYIVDKCICDPPSTIPFIGK
jgi:hypothetical protein